MQGKAKNAANSSLIVTRGLLDSAVQNVLSQVVTSQNQQDQRVSAELSSVYTELLAQRHILVKKGIYTEEEFVESIRSVLSEIKQKTETAKAEDIESISDVVADTLTESK